MSQSFRPRHESVADDGFSFSAKERRNSAGKFCASIIEAESGSGKTTHFPGPPGGRKEMFSSNPHIQHNPAMARSAAPIAPRRNPFRMRDALVRVFSLRFSPFTFRLKA